MYGKIFDQIYDGSLRLNWKALITFQQMIVLCDSHGIVDMTHEALHFRTGIPIEIIKEGVSELESPDKRSRSSKHGGRRIVRLDEHRDWGWKLVNHEYYRDLVSAEDRRDQAKLRKRRQREREKSKDVTPCHAMSRKSRHTDTDTNTDTDKKKNTKKKSACAWPKDFSLTNKMRCYAVDNGIAPGMVDAFFDDFRDRADAKGAIYKDWGAAFRMRVRKAQEYGKQFLAPDGTKHEYFTGYDD